MHFLLATILTLALVAGAPMARAADLSGIWTLDRAQWRQQLDAMVAAMLVRMPASLTANLQAQGVDPADALRRAASDGLDGTIEFLPGGIVRSVTPADGITDDGHWTLDGNRLRVEVGDVDGVVALVGHVQGDRIALKPMLDAGNPVNEPMRHMVYPLVRHH